jgi:hypothetical protein
VSWLNDTPFTQTRPPPSKRPYRSGCLRRSQCRVCSTGGADSPSAASTLSPEGLLVIVHEVDPEPLGRPGHRVQVAAATPIARL